MAYSEEIRAKARALYMAHPDWGHEDIVDELGKLFPKERTIPVERTVGYWVSGKKGRNPRREEQRAPSVEGEELLTGSSSEVSGLRAGSNQGVGSKVAPRFQRLAAHLLGNRDAVFQEPVLKPSEVIELFLRLRWSGSESLILEPTGTAEERELFEKRVQSRGPYLAGCRFLKEKITTAVEEAIKSTELVLVDQVPLEPNKTPDFVQVWPSS